MLTWNYDENDELWQHDNFETEEECVMDAKENYCVRVGKTIAIGTVNPYVVNVDIESVLEQIEEDAYEECGEVANDWIISNRKSYGNEMDNLQEKVTELVNIYLEKIIEKPTFTKIDSIYTVTVN